MPLKALAIAYLVMIMARLASACDEIGDFYRWRTVQIDVGVASHDELSPLV